jgi:hypothetical protein
MQAEINFYGKTITTEVARTEIIGNTEYGVIQHVNKFYRVSSPTTLPDFHWQIVGYVNASERVAELTREYKELQHTVRSSRLPFAPDAPIFQRMHTIRTECSAYGVDLYKSL